MSPSNLPSPRHLAMLAALLLLSVLSSSAIGCRAEMEIKQGADGEFCNGQLDDCRPGLSCVDYICQNLSGPTRCEEVCDKFEECGVTQDRCVGACENTIRQWSSDAKESFATCLVDDLSCDDIQELEDAPQECYNRLELPQERNELCLQFADAVKECASDVDTTELRRACRYMARTRSDEVWAYSQECVERVEDGVCPDIFHCLNDTFDIDPPLIW